MPELTREQINQWLKDNSASILFTPEGIYVHVEVRKGKYTDFVSGMHNSNPDIAVRQAMSKANKALKSISKNIHKLDRIVEKRNRK